MSLMDKHTMRLTLNYYRDIFLRMLIYKCEIMLDSERISFSKMSYLCNLSREMI